MFLVSSSGGKKSLPAVRPGSLQNPPKPNAPISHKYRKTKNMGTHRKKWLDWTHSHHCKLTTQTKRPPRVSVGLKQSGRDGKHCTVTKTVCGLVCTIYATLRLFDTHVVLITPSSWFKLLPVFFLFLLVYYLRKQLSFSKSE